MKNKAHDINTYSYKKGETFLFDANIWLYISAPPSSTSSHLTKKYSQALKSILSAGANLLISSTILSEYLNRYCRIEWAALHKANYSEFKKFRVSNDFKSVGAQAAAEAKQILSLCTAMNDQFETCDINLIINDFKSGVLDFNDGIITHFCLGHNCKLITNDADFTEGGIEILTGNTKLLTACPA